MCEKPGLKVIRLYSVLKLFVTISIKVNVVNRITLRLIKLCLPPQLLAGLVRFELTSFRLTAECSTYWAITQYLREGFTIPFPRRNLNCYENLSSFIFLSNLPYYYNIIDFTYFFRTLSVFCPKSVPQLTILVYISSISILGCILLIALTTSDFLNS